MTELLPDGALIDQSKTDYDSIAANFQWQIPSQINVAELVCSRHADGSDKLALIAQGPSGAVTNYSFDDIDRLSSQLANVLAGLGVAKGDRVAVILAQRVETALLHLAAQKLGAVSLPLSVLFGEDALTYRLQDSGSKVVVTTLHKCATLKALQGNLPALSRILFVDGDGGNAADVSSTEDNLQSDKGTLDFWDCVHKASSTGVKADTSKDDPAFLLYTSGTTGPPKGALVPQRALIGNLTGFECSHNGYPKPNDRTYTPADWAWTGGLLDALMPAWYYGTPVLAIELGKFDPEVVAASMCEHKVTCAFIPPTALKMMRAVPDLFERHPSSLRSIMSAGEMVGEELFNWGQQALQLDINEMCGQTEHNYLMGNYSSIMAVKPGSMGKAYPGHQVAIMDASGELLADGEVGEIVANRDDPVHFLGYWNNPEATASKYTGDWFHTGDVGYRDSDGYLWFMGRADDVISSAGYRIGPGEIEDCVLKHPAVLQVAAIGVPDPHGIRGNIVKLCIVLRDGVQSGADLEEAIRVQVRDGLAAYEYPRAIEFFTQLPMTTTGKVKRKVLREMHLEALKQD